MKNNTSLHDNLVEDSLTTIKRKILILSEEEIDQVFNNISKSIDNLDKCNELYILEQLRNKFEDQIVYYHLRLHRKYNWDAFNASMIALILTVVLIYLLYIAISDYNIITFLKALKKYDATFHYAEQPCTFAQYAEQYIKIIHDYLQATDNNNFFFNQLFIISKLAEPFIYISIGAYVLARTVLGFVFTIIVQCIPKLAFKSMSFLSLGTFIAIIAIFCSIGEWLWPKDKECYEKWNIIKEKVEKRLSVLKQ